MQRATYVRMLIREEPFVPGADGQPRGLQVPSAVHRDATF